MKFQQHSTIFGVSALLALAACSGGGSGSGGPGQSGGGGVQLGTLAGPSRSSNIALTSDDSILVVANRDANTVSILRVKSAAGADVQEKLGEVAVGQEPRSVLIAPNDQRAFIANTVSGTVSVLELGAPNACFISHEIVVGSEPRALAITPNGRRLYVANHTSNDVSVIDTTTLQVTATWPIRGNPSALAITNDGDTDDNDETVFVARFYAEPIIGGPGEVYDLGKQGVVFAFNSTGGAGRKIELSPLANVGFGADREPFCGQFNQNVHSDVFCPNTTILDPNNPIIADDPQGAFPNQIQSFVVRNNHLYVPSIAASPEPPVRFNVNVQALVHVVDTNTEQQEPAKTINLNAQIKLESNPPVPQGSLQRVFGNDICDIDSTQDGQKFLIVSRGGNYVIECGLDANGALTINAPANVVRYQTGNLPTGVVVSRDGRRAYTNNEVGYSVSALNLLNKTVITRDIESSNPPAPGTFAHGVLVGKLAFSTALGVPQSDIFASAVRDIDPTQHRNKASDNGWSSCASCHPDGLSDGVTWIFGTGPRQTLPLDAFFSKQVSFDQRISNWSGVMGSITDFNNNARGVQGGEGFAGNPPPSNIFQHGITEGGSDSLDAMTLWAQTIRAPILPPATNLLAAQNGEQTFIAKCAGCHGGTKWSKSQVIYDNNPTFNADPNLGGVPLDPGVVNAGPQIRSFNEAGFTLTFLDGVGTFDPNNPLEIRGQGATQGITALGALGYNAPSLLGVRYHKPYLHDGSAQTLQQVFAKHNLTSTQTIAQTLTSQEQADLEVYLNSIDGSTPAHISATDRFLQAIGH
jgi:YVTN family beta-propeller protein